MRKNSFLKMFVAFYLLVFASFFVDIYIVHAETLPVIVPVVALTEDRSDSPSVATVLCSDGNLYAVPCPWDDSFPGELWLCARDDKGTGDATDDEIQVLDYIGYEVWDPDISMYKWGIWDGSKGEYYITYSPY